MPSAAAASTTITDMEPVPPFVRPGARVGSVKVAGCAWSGARGELTALPPVGPRKELVELEPVSREPPNGR
jgi:hypothetical protein